MLELLLKQSLNLILKHFEHVPGESIASVETYEVFKLPANIGRIPRVVHPIGNIISQRVYG